MREDQPPHEKTVFPLIDIRVPTRLKLSSLWAATIVCPVHGNCSGPFVSEALGGLSRGEMDPLGQMSPGARTALALVMVVPGLMIALSVLLPAVLCTWACVVLGSFYSGIVALGMPGAGTFNQMLGATVICLTLALSIKALRWPRSGAG